MYFSPDSRDFRSDFKVFRRDSRDLKSRISKTPDLGYFRSDFKDYMEYRDFRDFRSDFRTFVHRISLVVCPSV